MVYWLCIHNICSATCKCLIYREPLAFGCRNLWEKFPKQAIRRGCPVNRRGRRVIVRCHILYQMYVVRCRYVKPDTALPVAGATSGGGNSYIQIPVVSTVLIVGPCTTHPPSTSHHSSHSSSPPLTGTALLTISSTFRKTGNFATANFLQRAFIE